MGTLSITTSDRSQTETDLIKGRCGSIVRSITSVSTLIEVRVVSGRATTVFGGWGCGPSHHVGIERRGTAGHGGGSASVVRIAAGSLVIVEKFQRGLDLPDVCQPPGVSGFGTSGVEGYQHHRSQNSDNGNHYQKLNKGKSLLIFGI